MKSKRTLSDARRAGMAAAAAAERFHDAIRRASEDGHTRTEVGDAVGLSRARIQQIVDRGREEAA